MRQRGPFFKDKQKNFHTISSRANDLVTQPMKEINDNNFESVKTRHKAMDCREDTPVLRKAIVSKEGKENQQKQFVKPNRRR